MKSSKQEIAAIVNGKAAWLSEHQKDGEQYAGIVLGKNGEPDEHVFLLPGEFAGNWKDAIAWAKSIGGELPTRQEQPLLFANCKESFKPTYYWSSEQHAYDSDCAWIQDFDNGNQISDHKSYSRSARAVRRLEIS